ncbi:hypothetical protein EV356DRAFT_339112 [Viridothelium virens]|uniref:Uncharacterized protein n=1 Tax=Viridothelium virens TaxID=1048519 RepID=A0A6A6HKX8_VIRVR|nr:hypothetical protein EV356DRAFT_339112 [Viridothelium virens]
MSRRSDGFDLASPKTQRSMSMSSDRPSLSGTSTMPTGIHPAPAYVAASAASQMVSDHHLGEDEEVSGIDEGALFSEGALASLNSFLDHLLYSFLASAKSTSLAALRPAVTDVLKTRLARDAVASADEDLADLLSGTEDEEELSYIQNGADANAKWDLETVWRRTRLRVMVYIRLGEMEDEDEERYLEEDEYFSTDDRRFSRSSGLVSWAAAIFLTSVIEYMAEQTIICAGKAAYAKALKRKASDARHSIEMDQVPTRIIVEDSDMEKVALDSTLSRLWRTWRRRLKSPSSSASTPAPSRIGTRAGSVTSPKRRGGSIDDTDGGFSEPDDFRTPSSLLEGEVPNVAGVRTEAPENIPLPMGDRDIDEIEMPGLANTFEDEPVEEEDEEPPRRASFITLMRSKDDSVAVQDDDLDERPILKRIRSRSLPIPGAFSNDSSRDQLFEKISPAGAEASSSESKQRGDDRHIQDADQNKRKSILATGASMAAAAGAAAYATVMGTRKNDEPSTPVSPGGDDERSFQARETHAREIDDVLDAQVLDSRRVSVIRPTDAPEIIRHESASSYSTSKSFSPVQKSQEAALESEKEMSEETKDVSPLQKEKEKENAQQGVIGVASSSVRPISPPSPTEDKQSRIPPQQRGSPDADDDARKLERITKVSAPTAAVAAVADAGAAAVAARKHAGSVHKATTQPWDEPSAEQFLAAESLQGPSRHGSPLQPIKTAKNSGSQAAVNKDISTPTPAKEKLRKPVPTDTRTITSVRQSDQAPSSESATSSTSDIKPEPLAIRTTDKSPSASPAEWSARASPATRRPTRGSKSSIDSLGDQHAQVTPISGSSARRRDFDSLIRGEETMKYTLTPQGMRDFENPNKGPAVKEAERPRASPKTSKPVQEQSRSADPGPAVQQTPDPNFPARSSSVTNKTPQSRNSEVGQPAGRSKSISRPPQRNFSGTKQGLVAREPQVQTVSTKDLADFFQTTAPDKEPEPILPISLNRSQPQPSAAVRQQSDAPRSSGSKNDRRNSFNKSPSRTSVANSNSGAPPVPVVSPKRTNLQARDAVAPSSGNSDLIDFIRQGPPSGPNGKNLSSGNSGKRLIL